MCGVYNVARLMERQTMTASRNLFIRGLRRRGMRQRRLGRIAKALEEPQGSTLAIAVWPMPRDGALTLSDVRSSTLSIVCEPCAFGQLVTMRVGLALEAYRAERERRGDGLEGSASPS